MYKLFNLVTRLSSTNYQYVCHVNSFSINLISFLYMWQSRLERFCLHGSQSLAPLRMYAMSYGPQNITYFGTAGQCNYCHVQQLYRPRQGAVHVLGRLFVDYLYAC